MAATVKQALADAQARADADALAQADAQAQAQAQADEPASEPEPEPEPADSNVSIGTASREQTGIGVKHFTLAPDAEWDTFTGGKTGVTIGNNNVRQLSWVPQPGRDQHIPLWVIAEAFASGAITL